MLGTASSELSRLSRTALEALRREGLQRVVSRSLNYLRRWHASDKTRIHHEYAAWVADQERLRPPPGQRLVSIVTPVKNPPVWVLRATARSVLRQSGRIEWCIADDGSRPEIVRELETIARGDRRVKVVFLESSRGISGATNGALALASGELVAFLDHDDELQQDAISWMERAFDDPGVGCAYSDEDQLDARGIRQRPFLKSDYSPDLHLTYNFGAHFLVARHELVRAVGGLRSEFDGSQDYDLLLRLSERARVAHVPRVLYHWRMLPGSVAHLGSAKLWAYDAGKRAIEAALARRGDAARVEMGAVLGMYILRREVDPDYRRHIEFFFDDALVPDARALETLAAHALRRDVALVTPRVIGWGNRLESAGWTLGFGRQRIAACPFVGREADDGCYAHLAHATRDVSATPPGAFAIERRKLEALGGVPPDVPRRHRGVALALRARDAGLRTVYSAEAILRRRSTRESPPETARDAAITRALLGARLDFEPHLSPHFVRGKLRLQLPRHRERGRSLARTPR